MTFDASQAVIICYVCLQITLAFGVATVSTLTVLKIKKQHGQDIHPSTRALIKLWFETSWKMRNIYVSLLVHIFDFFTDLLVIDEWFNAENKKDIDHIDGATMAYASISVLIFHKVVSAFAVFVVTEYDYAQSVLQFFDLLLFTEIYRSHKNLVYSLRQNLQQQQLQVHQARSSSTSPNSNCLVMFQPSDISKCDNETIKNENYNSNTQDTVKLKVNKGAVDSSMRFKYLRSLEAIFEATPQAVLQLVYVMRTKSFEAIFLISIFQSVLSMTNSMINADNVYMTNKKWDKYKKKFPVPSVFFLKHGLFRLFEIASRIGVLAIFWTVVGGEGFSILMFVEAMFPMIYSLHKYYYKNDATWSGFFLSLNISISLPPEWIFETSEDFIDGNDCIQQTVFNSIEKLGSLFGVLLLLVLSPILLLLHLIRFGLMYPVCQNNFYIFTSSRILITFIEWLVIILVATFDNEAKSKNFLFLVDHCLVVFVVCFSTFVIYSTIYPYLMPDIRLPDNINIRSKLGYAIVGNIDELTRLFDRDMNRNDKNSLGLQCYQNVFINQINKGVNEIDNDLIDVQKIIKEYESNNLEYVQAKRKRISKEQKKAKKEKEKEKEEKDSKYEKEGTESKTEIPSVIESFKHIVEKYKSNNLDNKLTINFCDTNHIFEIARLTQEEISKVRNEITKSDIYRKLQTHSHGLSKLRESILTPQSNERESLKQSIGKEFEFLIDFYNELSDDNTIVNNIDKLISIGVKIKYDDNNKKMSFKSVVSLFNELMLSDYIVKSQRQGGFIVDGTFKHKYLEMTRTNKKIKFLTITLEKMNQQLEELKDDSDEIKYVYNLQRLVAFNNRAKEEFINIRKKISNLREQTQTTRMDDKMFVLVKKILAMYWQNCIYYAQSNDQMQTVKWLYEKGATKEKIDENEDGDQDVQPQIIDK